MTTNNVLPSKLNAYVRRLRAEYQRDAPHLAAILEAARIGIIENSSYDNWNGGTNLHSVQLFLPPEALGNIRVSEQGDVASKICQDLNHCATGYDNEGFHQVIFEMDDENDPSFQKATYISQLPKTNPDALSIWKPGEIRLFISHRDAYKAQAHQLADALEAFGVSSFVAHDTIEPMTTWKDEILRGLETMEVMLALITDDFEQSYWTQQEIGFALGCEIQIIPVMVGSKAPPGFIASTQGLRARLDDLSASAIAIYQILMDKLGNKRLQDALVKAFVDSPNWSEARDRFDRLDKTVSILTDDQYIEIAAGFLKNDQLHTSIYLTNHYNRLKKFLEKSARRRIVISGAVISSPDDKHDDPF